MRLCSGSSEPRPTTRNRVSEAVVRCSAQPDAHTFRRGATMRLGEVGSDPTLVVADEGASDNLRTQAGSPP